MGAPTTRPDETFFAVEGLDYAHWCPSASCPEKQGMQDILLGLKEEKGFSYEVNHVRWEIEEGPDLHAMMVGPIDGPLDRDGQDWPELAAIIRALPDYTPGNRGRYVVSAWITPRIR